MNEEIRSVITPDKIDEDLDVELSLRPQKLADFVGQERLKDNLYFYSGGKRKTRGT